MIAEGEQGVKQPDAPNRRADAVGPALTHEPLCGRQRRRGTSSELDEGVRCSLLEERG